MITKKKVCVACEELCYIWSKKLCKTCFNKQHTPKSIKKYSSKGLEKKKLKTENTKKLHLWFQELWKNESHYSEISGKWLGNENSSAYWHHILPKSSYKEAEFDRENIIRLTLNEHTEVESNPTKFEIVNQKRIKLKEKYGII